MSGQLTDVMHDWASSFTGVNTRSGQPPAAPHPASAGASVSIPTAAAGDALPGPLPTNQMKDEDIAAEIMDKQAAILEGWQTALLEFDKTMTSASDAEATPNFQKTLTTFFTDKLMGAMIQHTPGASELDAAVKALDGEIKRAAAAGQSAQLRDFVIQHAKDIGHLKQTTLATRQGFISAVRARREAFEAPGKIAPAKGKGRGKPRETVTIDDSPEADAYGMMRMALMDTLDAVDGTLKTSTPEALFKILTEEWVRSGKVNGGLGLKFEAEVIIRLNPNYSILDAYIQGTGGQKLAEQLLRDSPDGVDVFGLKTKREIKLMAENGWPQAILTLDANGRDVSGGTFAEGDSPSLYKYLRTHRLGKTKDIKGG